MVNFSYEELKGDGGIARVQESARIMGDSIISELNDTFRVNTEFHSTFIHTVDDANVLMQTSGVVSGRGSVSATYVTDKSATDFLFSDLSGVLLPREIREGGGFYDIMKNIVKGFVNNALNKNEELSKKRMAICKSCSIFISNTKVCLSLIHI